MDEEKKYLTIKQAMEYLGIRGKATFYKLIKEGKIKPIKISTRVVLIDKNDLDRLIEESKGRDRGSESI